MLKIGLTGGIGSGKSTALAYFRQAGARTLNLDELARELCRKGRPGYRAVLRAFGPDFLDARGGLDRRRLGRAAFADARSRRRLERATWPLILRGMRRFLRRTRGPVLVVDAPLLFEAGLERDFDVTVLVAAPRRLQLARAAARGGLSRSEALKRLKAQWPMARKARRADVTIPNSGSRAGLKAAVREYQRAFELISQTRNKQ